MDLINKKSNGVKIYLSQYFLLMYQEVRDRTRVKAKTLLKALQRVEGVDEGPKWKIED